MPYYRCDICGFAGFLDGSEPLGDATCPNDGVLLMPVSLADIFKQTSAPRPRPEPAARWAAEEPFDWSSVAPSDAHLVLALAEYHQGRSFNEIVRVLLQHGLAPELVPELIARLACDRAFHLLTLGKSARAIEQALVQRGLPVADARAVVSAVRRQRETWLARLGGGRTQALLLVAGGCTLLATFLAFTLPLFQVVTVPSGLVEGGLGLSVVLLGLGGVFLFCRRNST